MSKVKRVVSKKLSDQRIINHYSSISLSNPSQTLGNLKQPGEKSEIFSESPYAQKLTKVRSTSILKDSSLYQQPSGLTSPPLNPKFSMNLKSKINLSNSFITKVKETNEPNVKIKKKPVLAQRQSIESQTYLIELKIDEISLKHKDSGISNEILDKYRECLEEIIYKDKVFGALLAKIKFAYEDWIKCKINAEGENSKMKNEIIE